MAPFRHRLEPFLPFLAHLTFVALTSLGVLYYVDGRHFHTSHRRDQIIQADGSTTPSDYSILQSDITTIISILASVARILGAWWATDITWRCIFLFMEKGGLSLQGVERMFGGFPPFPSHSTLGNQIVFLAILSVLFSSNFYSSILTGSITWKTGYTLSHGSKPVTNITRGATGNSLQDFLVYEVTRTQVYFTSAIMANAAWGGSGANSTTMKRVLPNIQLLSNGSILSSVTIPYFAVDEFTWIKDPDSVLTKAQTDVASDVGLFSPFTSRKGLLGLVPDNQWGPLNDSQSMREPHIENRTRLLVIRTKWVPLGANGQVTGEGCEQDGPDGLDIPRDVGRHRAVHPGASDECFAFASVRVRAGVTRCQSCSITLPTIVEHDGNHPLQLDPDPLTSQALAISAIVGTWMILVDYGVPSHDAFPDIQRRAVELLSRSYQVAWNSLTEHFGKGMEETELEIAVKTSQAFVQKWRVFFWIILHLVVLFIGLCFTAWHLIRYKQPWVENPAFAAFCLDTNIVREKLQGMGVDPWQPKPTLPHLTLVLENSGSSRRRVVEVSDNIYQKLTQDMESDQATETVELWNL